MILSPIDLIISLRLCCHQKLPHKGLENVIYKTEFTNLMELSAVYMEVQTVHNNLTIWGNKISYDSSAGSHLSGQSHGEKFVPTVHF